MDYSATFYEIEALLDLARSFDEGQLVEEIHELCYENEVISDILHNFWYSGELDEDHRKTLEWLYVTAWIGEGEHE